AVGVETDGHVELEAGGDDGAGCRDVRRGEGDDAGGVVDTVVGAGRLRHFGDGDQDRAGDRLGDVAGPGIEVGAVGLGELEQRGQAVTEAYVLVERGRCGLGRTGFPVGGIAPAEAVQAAAPFLEEGDHRVQVVE